MEEISLTYREYYYYILLADIAIGTLLGLIPLLLGVRKKKRNYGVIGFVASIVGGVISPVLSIIVVSIFVWLILKKPNAENSERQKPAR